MAISSKPLLLRSILTSTGVPVEGLTFHDVNENGQVDAADDFFETGSTGIRVPVTYEQAMARWRFMEAVARCAPVDSPDANVLRGILTSMGLPVPGLLFLDVNADGRADAGDIFFELSSDGGQFVPVASEEAMAHYERAEEAARAAVVANTPKVLPSPIRAAIAAGESWRDQRAGVVLVAARPGTTIRVYNRMVDNTKLPPPKRPFPSNLEPAAPQKEGAALISETKLHPRARNGDITAPGDPRGRFSQAWTPVAAQFIKGLHADEIAVRITLPREAPWEVGDELLVTTVAADGTESEPLVTLIAAGGPESRPREPELQERRIDVGDDCIEGASYAATPGAEVRLLMNSVAVAQTRADNEGRFRFPYTYPGVSSDQHFQVAVGKYRKDITSPMRRAANDEDRVRIVLSKVVDQLMTAPNSDGTLALDVTGAGPGSVLRVRLPDRNAEYEVVADASGRLRETLEEIRLDERLVLLYGLPGTKESTRDLRAGPPDLRGVRLP